MNYSYAVVKITHNYKDTRELFNYLFAITNTARNLSFRRSNHGSCCRHTVGIVRRCPLLSACTSRALRRNLA